METAPSSRPADAAPGAMPAWAKFLVGDMDAMSLRIFEVLFTLSFWLWMGDRFLSWREWLTEWGFHLSAKEHLALGYPAPFPLLTSGGVALLGAGMFLAGLGLICNKARRLSLLLLFGTSIYVLGADYLAAGSINKFFVAVYGILLFSPGYVRDALTGRMTVSAVAVRVIQATCILNYFASGISKAFHGDWLTHSDVLYTMIQGEYRTDFAAWCLRTLPVWSWAVMQWTALLFELEAPVLFCVRKLRPIAFFIGIGFHFMIALMMKDLIFFSAQMWTFYALFVTAEEWRRLGAWLSRSWRRTCGRTACAAPGGLPSQG